jgi:hypothetical protein
MLGNFGGFALLLAGEYMIGAKPQHEYLQHDYTSVSRVFPQASIITLE